MGNLSVVPLTAGFRRLVGNRNGLGAIMTADETLCKNASGNADVRFANLDEVPTARTHEKIHLMLVKDAYE